MNDTPNLEIDDERLRRLLGYWQGHCHGRPFPAKANVDPVDFSYVLGYVTLVDVEHDPRRYYFRLDGSILVEMSGMNYTGRYLDELGMPEYIAFVKETYDRVVDSGLPYRYRKAGVFDQQQFFSEETLILPLGDAPKVERLLVAVIPGELPHKDDSKVVI